MENFVVRQRYTSRPLAARRRRRVSRAAGGSLQRTIARQFIICTVLLVMISVMKNINISATNFVTDQVKYILNYNIDLKNVFSYVDKLATDIRKSIVPVTADKSTSTDNQTSTDTQTSTDNQTSTDTQTSTNTQTSAGTQTSNITPTSVTAPSASIDKKGTDAADATLIIDTEDTYPSMENDAGDKTNTETAVLSASSEVASPGVSNMLEPADGTLSSLYGGTTDMAAGNMKIHNGIDISVNKGSSVKAVLDGIVTAAGSSPEYGTYIRITHANDLQTVYANCNDLIVKKDDNVKGGDIIASIGNPGISAGAHLHFEVWKDGVAVDPLEYISVPAR